MTLTISLTKLAAVPLFLLWQTKYSYKKGTFAEVWSVTHKLTKDLRAVKLVKKSLAKKESNALDMLMDEFEALLKLDSPNVMKIYDVFEDDHKYYIVTDLMQGPTLMEYFGQLPESTISEKLVAGCIKQILSGLCHCHSKKIAHRDIKPDNIMFSDKECKNIKLIDFGFAKIFDPQGRKFQEVLGSPMYMCPEVCYKKPYDLKCDIWSCGILTYLLLSGESPYPIHPNAPLSALLDMIKSKEFRLEDLKGKAWDPISVEAKKFMLKMLEVDPDKRATAMELLRDPWIETAKDTPIGSEQSKQLVENMRNCAVIFPGIVTVIIVG